jgi:basic membrane protein A
LALALAGAIALSVAGCSEDAPSSTTSEAPKFKACIVSDTGGFDDRSFNQISYAGVLKAQTDFGIEINKVQSAQDADYATNIQSMIDADCSIVIAAGYLLSDSIKTAAAANPDVYFAIVDDPAEGGTANLRGLTFQTNEPGFLAGYLAAGLTKTGTVATFSGMEIPSVTIFMDGYAQGVEYYNTVKGTNVKVIGWDRAAKTGTSADNFGDAAGGKTIADTQVSQGADILFPVAGGTGNGALQSAQENSDKVVGAIWVDTDGYVTASEYGAIIITSVEKAVDVAVYEAIKAAYENKWVADPFVGTLANKGVKLSDYHDFDAKIPAGLKTEITDLSAKIASGEIKVKEVGEA